MLRRVTLACTLILYCLSSICLAQDKVKFIDKEFKKNPNYKILSLQVSDQREVNVNCCYSMRPAFSCATNCNADRFDMDCLATVIMKSRVIGERDDRLIAINIVKEVKDAITPNVIKRELAKEGSRGTILSVKINCVQLVDDGIDSTSGPAFNVSLVAALIDNSTQQLLWREFASGRSLAVGSYAMGEIEPPVLKAALKDAIESSATALQKKLSKLKK